jgi:hypothetical protein
MAAAFGSMLALAGCGSAGQNGAGGATGTGAAGGTSGPGDDGGSTCAPIQVNPNELGSTSGVMSWRDDGSLQCPYWATAVHRSGTGYESLSIGGTTSTGTQAFVDLSGDPGLAGTFPCDLGNGAAPYASLQVVGNNGGTQMSTDCTITIGFSTDAAGALHAQGTFTGTAATYLGGVEVVTAGTFDLVTTGG